MPVTISDWTFAHRIVCVHKTEGSAQGCLLLVFLRGQRLVDVFLCGVSQRSVSVTKGLENILLFNISIVRDQTTNVHVDLCLPDERWIYPLLGRTLWAWRLLALALLSQRLRPTCWSFFLSYLLIIFLTPNHFILFLFPRYFALLPKRSQLFGYWLSRPKLCEKEIAAILLSSCPGSSERILLLDGCLKRCSSSVAFLLFNLIFISAILDGVDLILVKIFILP